VGPGPRVRDWAVGFGGDEEAHYRGWRFAPAWRFAFFALGNQHTSCMTCGTEPPCHRLGRPSAHRGRFPMAFRSASRRVHFKKGFTPRAAVILSLLSHLLRPFASELCFALP
jgi:hypothetical protein